MFCKVLSGRTSTSPPVFPPSPSSSISGSAISTARVHRVRVANAALIKPAEFTFASGLYALH